MPKPFTTYQKLLGVTAVIVIIIGIWFAYHAPAPDSSIVAEQSGQQPSQTGDQTSASSTPSSDTTASTTVASDSQTFINTQNGFQFSYPNTWKQTSIFNIGAYEGAFAFVPIAQEAALKSELKPTSASITATIEDNVLFFRIIQNTSINSIIASLYGNGVVVSNASINGKNIAHIVHSKSSDPTNWQGGSTEAYIFRSNTLAEAIVVEANYSTPEPPSDSPLQAVLQQGVSTMNLNLQ